KLEYLKKHSLTDYLIAKPFPLPKYAKMRFVNLDDEEEQCLPVIHTNALIGFGGIEGLFGEVYEAMEKDLPAQSIISIPEDPLVVITPLLFKNEEIYPYINKQTYL